MAVRSAHKPEELSPEAAAADWFIRHDRGQLSPQELEAFYAWLSESPRHEIAYEKACAAWGAFDDSSSDPGVAALREEALRARLEARRRWWLPAGGAIAAGIAAAMLFLPGAPVRIDQPAPVVSTASTRALASDDALATRKGERRVISLSDGSSVTLNTDTAIEVAYTAGQRLIRLSHGQALFEVARDQARPFIVEAGGRQVRAIGTIFEVRLDPGRMKVLLVEGRVVVDKLDRASDSAAVRPTFLRPGEELLAELGAVQKVAPVNVTSQLLWKDGYVEFHDEPLGTAVAEINRYSDREIVVKDARLASLRLSGVFRTGDPQRFSALVSELLPVTTRPGSGGRLEMVAAD